MISPYISFYLNAKIPPISTPSWISPRSCICSVVNFTSRRARFLRMDEMGIFWDAQKTVDLMIFYLENQCHIFVKGFSLKTPKKNKEWLVFNIISSATAWSLCCTRKFLASPSITLWAKIATLDVGWLQIQENWPHKHYLGGSVRSLEGTFILSVSWQVRRDSKTALSKFCQILLSVTPFMFWSLLN